MIGGDLVTVKGADVSIDKTIKAWIDDHQGKIRVACSLAQLTITTISHVKKPSPVKKT